jgi:hemolysin activation/secretion protein
LRQHIEQSQGGTPLRGLSVPEATPSPSAASAPAPSAPTGIKIQVRTFRFQGNQLLDSAHLQSALTSYLNRPLDYRQLQGALVLVTDLYQRAGWVVRASLPEQEIADGEVLIRVVEATFGGTRVQLGTTPRVSLERVQA